MEVSLSNRILTPKASRSLGFPWAAVIPALITASAGVATTIIAARTSKKNNEAAKELAQMQIDAQRSATSNYTTQTNQPTPTTQLTAEKQDNTLLYAAIVGLALIMILKK